GRKLAPALGINNRAKRSNPYLLESWRSQHSLTNLRLNLEALQRLMHQGGLEDFLMAKQQPQLAAEINAHLQQLLEKLPAAEAGLFTLIKEQDVDAITAVYQQLPELIALFKRELPGKLDLQMGFNSNDGD
ncbi:MAG: imelysin family protein, partial [Pseudomonadota bacterium]